MYDITVNRWQAETEGVGSSQMFIKPTDRSQSPSASLQLVWIIVDHYYSPCPIHIPKLIMLPSFDCMHDASSVSSIDVTGIEVKGILPLCV